MTTDHPIEVIESHPAAVPAPISQPGLRPDDSKDLISLLIDEKTIRELWNRITRIQERVTTIINDKTQAVELLDKIQTGRGLLLAGSDTYDEATRLIAEVEHAVELKSKVITGSKRVAPWLFVYELVWLVALGWLTYSMVVAPISPAVGATPALININQLLTSLCWGGMGGVVGAFFALWKHVAVDQDFDSQYSMWYFTNPIMGVALGGFVFLVIQAGFLSLTAGATGGEAIQSALVIYVLAWVCGFKQNVVFEIVRRILDVFKVNSESKNGEVTAKTPPDAGGVG